MNRIFAALLLSALSFAVSAEVWQARYGVAETFNFKLYNADGTLDVDEADGGTEVSLSCNEGVETTATNDFVDEGTFYSIALTAAELQCERIAIVVAATTTEVFFIQTINNASAMTPQVDGNLVNIAGSAVSTSTAQLGVNVVNAAGTAWGSGAITAASIATDAIGAAEIAADAIGASELATGAITTAEFAAGAINAAAIASDAIGAAEVATDVSTEFSAATFTVNATQISGDSGAADALETAFDGTAGAVSPLGIARQGTAQSATGSSLVLDSSASFADDTAIGMTLVACGSTQGYCQSRAVTDYVSSTDTATVDTWTVTPSGTVTYYLFLTAPSSGGGGGDATAANQTQILADIAVVDGNVDTLLSRMGTPSNLGGGATVAANLSDIEGQTDDIGAAGAGLTAVDDAIMTRVGAPVGASISADIAAVKTDTEATLLDTGTDGVVVAAGSKTGYALSATGVDAIWDEAQSGHVSAGTFGAYLDSSVSGVSTGGVSAAEIADAVLDEALSGHATAGTAGAALSGIQSDTDDLQTQIGVAGAGLTAADDAVMTRLGSPAGASVSADIAAVEAQTDDIGVAGAGLTAADDAVLAAVEQTARADAAVLNCEVNTANFAGSTTTLACVLTDRDGGAITAANGDLEGKELLILSGAQIYEGRFINDTTWDSGNSELRLTLSRALPGTLADAVTAIIR